jgi:hypothetical protein
MKKVYSVYVGGGEVNENYINDIAEAEEVAECWKQRDYDDVSILEVSLDENNNEISSSWL